MVASREVLLTVTPRKGMPSSGAASRARPALNWMMGFGSSGASPSVFGFLASYAGANSGRHPGAIPAEIAPEFDDPGESSIEMVVLRPGSDLEWPELDKIWGGVRRQVCPSSATSVVFRPPPPGFSKIPKKSTKLA